LDFIIQNHPDITHVVHLAQDVHASEQAIPRVKEEVLAGMMEALLEQVLQMPTIPHFLYASSYEVYNHLFPSLDYKNPVPFFRRQTNHHSLVVARSLQSD
jgi:nucleoside-diphosphate-sugar epimerase